MSAASTFHWSIYTRSIGFADSLPHDSHSGRSREIVGPFLLPPVSGHPLPSMSAWRWCWNPSQTCSWDVVQCPCSGTVQIPWCRFGCRWPHTRPCCESQRISGRWHNSRSTPVLRWSHNSERSFSLGNVPHGNQEYQTRLQILRDCPMIIYVLLNIFYVWVRTAALWDVSNCFDSNRKLGEVDGPWCNAP